MSSDASTELQAGCSGLAFLSFLRVSFAKTRLVSGNHSVDSVAPPSISDELSYVKPHKYGVAGGVQWPCVFIFPKSVFCQDPTLFWESLGGLSRSTIHL